MDEFINHAPVLLPLLAGLGLLSGFMAGLLGIGGGIILVPGLYFLFKTLGYDPALLMHMAVGTSLAIIIPTGIISARSHNKRGAVRWDVVKKIGPGIVIGVVAGTATADYLSGDSLTVIFAVALIGLAVLMQLSPVEKENATLNQPLASIGGFGVGWLSSLMGIGGATLNVPFMTMHGISIHRAVGSSSALGPFIALPGTIGFIVIGWNVIGLPAFSWGYVNLVAMLLIIPFSMLAAPLGVRAAHGLPVKKLRLVFALFVLAVAIKMGAEAFYA